MPAGDTALLFIAETRAGLGQRRLCAAGLGYRFVIIGNNEQLQDMAAGE